MRCRSVVSSARDSFFKVNSDSFGMTGKSVVDHAAILDKSSGDKKGVPMGEIEAKVHEIIMSARRNTGRALETQIRGVAQTPQSFTFGELMEFFAARLKGSVEALEFLTQYEPPNQIWNAEVIGDWLQSSMEGLEAVIQELAAILDRETE